MSSTIGTPVNSTPQPFVDGTQPDTSPQLTTPEGIEGLAAPGQENLVEEFAREQEEAAQEEAILGKFKSPYELAKAYSELQKKLGQRAGDEAKSTPEAEPESDQGEAVAYSAETAAEVYGQEAVEGLAEKGLDLGKIMFEADQGHDISEHYDALAEQFNVPKQAVEMFVSKQQSAPAGDGDGLSEADADSILSEIGGQKAFEELQAWGRQNMTEAERASYNAAHDAGNAEAVRWALKSLQARQGLIQQDTEPELYGGGAPSGDRQVFQSQQQVLDAMNKRNDMGQRLYDVDEAYRNKVANMLYSSPDF